MISMTPWSNSPRTADSATTSSAAARFDGTGRPSCAWCTAICDVENPIAPSRIAVRTRSAMAAISSSVAARSWAASPITARRTAEWPT